MIYPGASTVVPNGRATWKSRDEPPGRNSWDREQRCHRISQKNEPRPRHTIFYKIALLHNASNSPEAENDASVHTLAGSVYRASARIT